MAKKADFKKRTQDQIFTLHISLESVSPVVWRRLMVPGLFTLDKLHSVLQFVMGWQMSHLYDFEINRERYAEPDDFDETKVKSLAASLTAAVKDQKTFFYNYDFGDSWRHKIVVEDIHSREEMFTYPICIGGENACPPEDSGGAPGFEELKKTLADKKSAEHKEMLRWVGGYYDPKSFDANRINRDMLWMVDWNREPNDQGLYLPFNADDDETSEKVKFQ
jgi:hypothetical protein